MSAYMDVDTAEVTPSTTKLTSDENQLNTETVLLGIGECSEIKEVLGVLTFSENLKQSNHANGASAKKDLLSKENGIP